MPATLDYYLTPISPWTYLGSERFAAMVHRHGIGVRVRPVEYGVIFPQTGGLPLAQRSKERQAYRLMELKRWPKQLGLPLTLHPKHFPTPDLLAATVILAAGQTGGDPLRLANAIGRAVWVEERNIADAATLQEIAAATGHDGTALLARASDPAIRAKRDALTQEALTAGVFGAPTYVVDGELFWGQDRLDFLERKLAER
jgi:carboxymethylenebutenolidase